MKRILLFTALLLLGSALVLFAGRGIVLAWDPNPEPDIAGYRIYAGSTSRVYTVSFDTVSNVTSMSIWLPGFNKPTNYLDAAQRTWPSNEFWYPTFFAATAYNTSGLESDFSNEISFTADPPPPRPPAPPGALRIGQ